MKDCTGKICLVISILVLLTLGCRRTEQPQSAADNANGSNGSNEQNRENDDYRHAQELWSRIKNYSTWTQPEGFVGWDEGVSPHGAILRYYINDAAEKDLTGDGAVIVKENYTEKSEDALDSITVMEKRAGYDPETENWFYVKYSPDGEVMEGPDGAKLAGLLGKGQPQGCVPCHKTAGGNDYLFMND